MRFQPRSDLLTGRIAELVRYLNKRYPRAYWVLTSIPRLLAGRLWLAWIAHKGLGKPLSSLDFPRIKTSDTLFVLATGASINQYPDDYWRVVERHDSIGMNFFALHDFVPDLYVLENMEEAHRKLLAMKAEAYQDVPVILKTAVSNLSPKRVRNRVDKFAMNPRHVTQRFYLSLDLLAAGHDIKQTHDAYRLMRQLGLFSIKPRFLVLTKRRGSISYIINLAVRMGYKHIVLCGVDLNHPEYFYDSRREELESAGFPVPSNPHKQGVHLTNDPSHHPVTMQEVIQTINQEVLQPMGVQLYVGAKSSALHPEFPEYSWVDTRSHLSD